MNKKILIFGIMVLFIIPFINADVCPSGLPVTTGTWYCGSDGTFVNLIEGYYCPNDDAWINSDTLQVFSTIAIGEAPVFNCIDPFGGPSCCPDGSTCLAGGTVLNLPNEFGSAYSCQADTREFCNDFNDENACNSATFSIAKNSMDPGMKELDPIKYKNGYCGTSQNFIDAGSEICWDDISCGCFWNDTVSTGAICTVRDTSITNCTISGGDENYDCQWDVNTVYKCDTKGIIEISWNPVSGVGCASIPDSVISCADVIKLEFFSLINMIMAVMLIAGYYVYSSKQR